MAKSPKSLSRKGSIVEGNHIGSLFNSMNESKSPCAGTSVSNLFQGRKDRKKKPTSIILNFEDDLKRYFNGYFSSKQAFMSTNNSINKSLCENRRGKDRVGRREYAPG